MTQFFNSQAEMAILGTCILNNAYLAKIADLIEEKHFYYEENKVTWNRFVEVANEMTADEVTLGNFFETNEILKEAGGQIYLQNLLSEASVMIDIRDYAKTIIGLWQKRELQKLLAQSLESLNEKKFEFVSANLENEISGLEIQEPKKKTQHVSEILEEMRIEEEAGISAKFVPTGFEALDKVLNGGIYAQQMMIVGARPSVGKTSIAQQIILNASKSKRKCLFISLEVSKKDVVLKFLANLSSVGTWKISKNFKKTQSEEGSLVAAKNQLKDFGIYTNDSSYLTISQIGRIIKNQIEKQPVDLVVIDYVQIVRSDDGRGRNEATIIKETTTALKAMAKQYDVSMLALAQINRKAVEGANQVPTMNDFKGSGGIEEDADVAVILHRDRTEGKEDGYFSSSGKLIVAKNRHGRTGEIPIHFEGEFGRFNELNNNF